VRLSDAENARESAGVASAERRVRGRTVVIAAATVLWLVGATTVLLLRQAGTPSWDTIWAEDGPVFYSDALTLSYPSALIKPYAGYGHLLPRTLAAVLVHVVSPSAYALAAAMSASLVVATLGLFVFFASAKWFPSPFVRGFLVIVFVLLPTAQFEVTATLANLQWFLALPCFFALLADHDTRRFPADGVVAFVSAATSPQTLLLAPLALWRAWRGAFRERMVAGLFAIGALYQLFVTWRAQSDNSLNPYGVGGIVRAYSLRVASALVIGPKLFEPVYSRIGGFLPVVAVVVVGLILIPLGESWSVTRRRRLVGALAVGLAIWILSYVLRGVPGPTGHEFSEGGSRYVLSPQLFLIVGALVAFDGPRRTVQVKTAVAALWLLVVLIPNIRQVNVRSQGPSWDKQLAVAKQQCRTAPPGSTAGIAISPAGWYVAIPCSDL
jgi:hypothetical protein